MNNQNFVILSRLLLKENIVECTCIILELLRDKNGKGNEIRMKVQDEFVLREIAGDYVIIPTGKTVLKFNGLITVNEVGAYLWKLLQKEVDLDGLVKGVLEEYDVDEKTARLDIQEFLDTLKQGGVLEDQRRAAEDESCASPSECSKMKLHSEGRRFL